LSADGDLLRSHDRAALTLHLVPFQNDIGMSRRRTTGQTFADARRDVHLLAGVEREADDFSALADEKRLNLATCGDAMSRIRR
jgi:hypothetical protein